MTDNNGQVWLINNYNDLNFNNNRHKRVTNGYDMKLYVASILQMIYTFNIFKIRKYRLTWAGLLCVMMSTLQCVGGI